MYSNVSNQFVALVKGELREDPVPVGPAFRLKMPELVKKPRMTRQNIKCRKILS